MFKLLFGLGVGFALGAKLGEAGFEDLLKIVQETLANEQIASLVRDGAAAVGDGVRTLGVALTEEAPARLAERNRLRELQAS